MKSKKGPVTLIVIGALLTLGPAWGLLGTVIAMVRAFFVMGQPGATSEQLASSIRLGLWSTADGLIVFPIGCVMLVGGIIWLHSIRKPACCR